MITLVTTVLNERQNIEQFMDSILLQTRKPDEIIVLDGGSSDGTVEYLKEIRGVRVPIFPTCNIKYCSSPVARGRNLAIAAANGDIIAVTDAGCRLHPRWLEEITRPIILKKADVVGGATEPWMKTYFHAIAWVIWGVGRPETIGGASSRSIAFRKELWEKAGRYPEIALTAEDTMFNQNLESLGARYEFAEKAIVYWQQPGTLKKLLRQSYRYAKGEAICRTGYRLYVMKLLKFGLLVLVIALLVDWARIVGFAVGLFKLIVGKPW
jgi:glycosyltransferase involved in cell wall biosynthesis